MNENQKGRNLALSRMSTYMEGARKSSCVFISHKKEDVDVARAISEYLMNKICVDVYFDENDNGLQAATQVEDDRYIVESIKRGLACSTHLLCLISDKTKLSWWVPYEIGIMDNKGLSITSLKLRGIDELPSFLKINKVLYTCEDFANYVHTLGPYGTIFTEGKKYDAQSIRQEFGRYID